MIRLINETKSRAVLFAKTIIYINERKRKNVALDKCNNNSCFSTIPLGTKNAFDSILLRKYLEDLYKYKEKQPNKMNSNIKIR